MKKIAILVPDLSLGGGQRVAINTAHLLATDYIVHIVIFTNENQLFETNLNVINLKIKKKESLAGKFLNIYMRVRAYRKILKREKYDVTISFLESANLCAFICNRNKSILTLHAKPNLLTKFDQLVLRYLFKYSPSLIAVSKGLKKELETNYNLRYVSVINNPIDKKDITTQASQSVYRHPRKFIVSSGRLTSTKRFDLMIKLFLLSKASKEFDLVILGDGEDLEELKCRAKIASNVHLLGEIANPFPVIKAAELFVMTSELEAFPMVLLESLILSTPVLAFNCPTGLKEIVKNNKNGLLLENRNHDDFIKAIDLILFNDAFKNKLIKESASSVQKFQSENILIEWDAILQEVTS